MKLKVTHFYLIRKQKLEWPNTPKKCVFMRYLQYTDLEHKVISRSQSVNNLSKNTISHKKRTCCDLFLHILEITLSLYKSTVDWWRISPIFISKWLKAASLCVCRMSHNNRTRPHHHTIPHSTPAGFTLRHTLTYADTWVHTGEHTTTRRRRTCTGKQVSSSTW